MKEKVLAAISENPKITQKELAFAVGVSRGTVMRVVTELVREGLLEDKRYVLPKMSQDITGFVLVKSPELPDDIDRIENAMNSFSDIGKWNYLTGRSYDYIFLLNCGNNHPRLSPLFKQLREIAGRGTETHFILPDQ